MDELLRKVRSGAVKLYALEREVPPGEAVAARRAFIEEETGTRLPAVGAFSISPDRVTKRNCENMIGAVQV
ncbi:MAG TPA: 3-hydroxy-3-methylglutaryl-CoA reductase, partial [Methanoregulaceae archaeon]|nr:3-hydroxy-3-methylglutaryl-CoA reductase [Methanoregulaceae archaeon]